MLTNRNPCGITPTISRGRESTVMLRPIDRPVSAEAPLPVSVAEHHGLPASRGFWSAAESQRPSAGGTPSA